ncbi:conjugal transfer protein TraB [Streptomyces niveus]|uniref:conjugal transfer protein TraB n=1 Tax=Streptomyces niveus TaxID=193462 RepID=UPI0036D0AD65
MSGDLVPRAGDAAPMKADADNRYKAVQNKLKGLATALDDAALELESLWRSTRANADRTEEVSRDSEHADLDPKFVELTSNVAEALHGASRRLSTLHDSTQETATLTHRTQRTHAKLYGPLDDIRSNRRVKTPKPAFFNN